MKKKIIVSSIMMLVILIFLMIGCSPSTKILSADIIITDWEQNYYDWSWGGEWSNLVKVWYKITNTGTVDIDYYQIWFTAKCIDGSTYEDWTNGLFVDVGHYEFDYMFIDVPDKQAISVEMTDFELENFWF